MARLPTLTAAAAALAAVATLAWAAAPVAGALTAAEVKALIVGHSVANADKSMTWYYHPGGKYESDDGRNGREGTYAVGADGRLCWSESTGVKGCFQYVRKGRAIVLHRKDSGKDFDLGPVTPGPM